MSFWNSGGGNVTGNPQDAFVSDFTIIPNNTTAPASIKSISLIEKENRFNNSTDKYYEFTYKLLSGDFKGREVAQKIKCFQGEQSSIQRALNMLKLIMDLCDYKPSHGGEPTAQELMSMQGKVLGIKIREWQMQKVDGSGTMEGNFVAEVHKIDDKFITETGVKLKPKMPEASKHHDNGFDNFTPDNEKDDSIPF